jgi:aldehyde:ferredoxin oxidoreductase
MVRKSNIEAIKMGKEIFGFMGKILRVNLGTGKISIESLERKILEAFLGGRGLGAKILYDELKPGVDPLGPENKLVFMTGPATGTPIPTANRTALIFKSPLTGYIAHSTAGGHFGPELKFAGYDGIIVEGESEKPVYLLIDNEDIDIKDAKHLWGKDVFETEKIIREKNGSFEMSVASIGLAGEKLSKMANVKVDFFRSFGRCGCGAVMGSKKLKSIAVRGVTHNIQVPNIEEFKKVMKYMYQQLKIPDWSLPKFGTVGMIWVTNTQGVLPTRNFQASVFEYVDLISPEEMKRKLVVRDRACYACPVACGKYSVVKDGPYTNTCVEGPEYETLYAFGPYCGVKDLNAIAAANLLCDEFGIDTISAGVTIGFAMECYEKGLLTKQDAEGLELTWGNAEAVIELVKKIGKREGLGEILADGVRVAAGKIGKGSEKYAMHVKGLELPGYDPRGLQGSGLGFATSNRGGCHSSHYVMSLELSGKVDRFETKNKGKLTKELQDLMAIFDSLILCKFIRYGFPLTFEAYLPVVQVVTGMKMDANALSQIGERIFNIERMFNVREGIGRKDDTLPSRLLNEPVQEGPSKGHIVRLNDMLGDYYTVRGWDENGIPSAWKLAELGLDTFLDR